MRFVPALRKKRATSGACLAGKLRLTVWISPAYFNLAGLPLRFRRQDTRTEAFLRNLLTIARNRGEVNDFHPAPRFFPIYSIECRTQAPFSRAKSAWRLLLNLLPGLWAIPCSASGTPSRFTASAYSTLLAVDTPGITSS